MNAERAATRKTCWKGVFTGQPRASDMRACVLEAVGPEIEATAAEVVRREEALTEAVHLEGDPENRRGLRAVQRKRQVSPPGMPCATRKAESQTSPNTLPPS